MGMLVILALFMTSCSKEETPTNDPSRSDGTVALQFGAVLNDLSNRAMSRASFDGIPSCRDAEPATAEIAFSYGGNDYSATVNILHDDDGYFTEYSEDLKIPVPDEGSVTVTLNEFVVYDAEHTPLWVAPVGDDADFAGYVDEALPQDFEVRDGTKPYIDVEVLCYDRRMANEYGYPFFDVNENYAYTLCFFANYCVGQRHYVGNYSIMLEYYDGENWMTLYENETPDVNNNNDSADPLCIAIPDSPFGNPNMDYLRYTVTPLSWPSNYGNIDEAPLEPVYLNWTEVESLFNDDGTTEYIHLFLGCDDIPQGDCPSVPIPNDRDGDCIPDNEDDCPDTPGLPEYNGCPDDACIGEDSDGDGLVDDCDQCPDVAGPIENGGCPYQDCTSDSDGDGVNDCEDQCPDVQGPADNDGCPEDDHGGTCETANMFGDTPINTFSNAHKWGWAEYYEDGQEQTEFKIYAGAGQNDLSKGTWVGTATVEIVDGVVNLEIDMKAGYSLDELHVNLTDEKPSGAVAKAPGQFNMNDMVSPGTTHYEFTDFTGFGDDFWIIVHTVTCGLGND